MKREVVKQILFLVFFALMLVLVMGIIIYTNVRAQGWGWEEDFGRGKRSSFDVRYNRVEGLYTGVRIGKEYWRQRHPSRPFLYGFSGYSFSAKEFQYQAGIEKGFLFGEYRLAFGGESHRMVDTPDRWIIPDGENSLAAFLLKEDFQDFFLREGSSGYIVQSFTRVFSMSMAYHYDVFDSLEKNTNWSFFGGKKHFRENPAMSSGVIRSEVVRLVVDSRNSVKKTTKGWYIQIEGEHAGNELKGDFNFDRLLADVRRYQPLGFGTGVDFRIRVGTSHGRLPWQRSYHLGGLSTLRAFPYKAFPHGFMKPGGNRMVLAQLEYRMGSQDLPDELAMGILDHFNLILFADVGWVGNAGIGHGFFEGFEGLSLSNMKSDVGIALANRSGSMRFQIARRTDTGKKPFVFSFRISRPF